MDKKLISVLKSSFPRWKMSSVYKLALQIHAIDVRLRSGYLWDLPEPLPATVSLMEILKSLLNNRVIQREIQVIRMEMEVFLINRESLCQNLLDPDRFVFLDISSDFRIVARGEAKVLLHQLEANVSTLDFPKNSNTCLATISGLIIDYPVIFYYDDPDLNRPSGSQLLKVYKVFSITSSPLYSFSIPAVFLDSQEIVRKHMKRWRTRIESLGLRIEEDSAIVTLWVL